MHHMQKSLFDSNTHNDLLEHLKPQTEHIDMPDAEVWLVHNWIKPDAADKLLSHFREHLEWNQPKITLFGKSMSVPRLQAWYGDAGIDYTYSGLKMQPLPWEEKLLKVKQACEKTCEVSFNSVLANLYRDGQDSMGMHADNEPERGSNPVIASLSLGASRNFDFKHIKTGEKRRIVLNNGSLLIMRGCTQQFWHHGINKTKRVNSPRINFTFRNVNPQNTRPK